MSAGRVQAETGTVRYDHVFDLWILTFLAAGGAAEDLFLGERA